jgi:hypothetical protein
MPPVVLANLFEFNFLPATPASSIFCRDFRLSPLMFSIFYRPWGRGEGILTQRRLEVSYQVASILDSD